MTLHTAALAVLVPVQVAMVPNTIRLTAPAAVVAAGIHLQTLLEDQAAHMAAAAVELSVGEVKRAPKA